MGIPAVTQLGDEHRIRRAQATILLGNLKDVRAVEPLIVTLKDQDKDVYWGAVRALGQLGHMAFNTLIATLKDENSNVRQGVALALGIIGEARVIEPLIAMLKDEDMAVRKDAATALAKVGDTQAIAPIIYSLSVLDNMDLIWGLDVLRLMGDSAIEVLIGFLRHREPRIRWLAVWILGNLGDIRAVDPLISMLEDQIPEIQSCVINALRNLGTPKALNTLNELGLVEVIKMPDSIEDN